MAFSTDDAQATRLLDLRIGRQPIRSDRLNLGGFISLAQRFVFTYGFNDFFNATAQHNIRSTTRHIGGDRNVARLASLSHDLRLSSMLLSIQNFVTQTCLIQQARKQLGVFDTRCSHKNGLPALLTIPNIFENRIKFFTCCFKNLIILIGTHHRAIGRHNDCFKSVNFLKLERFSIRRTRHPTKLFVHTEKILKRNRRHRLIFVLNLYAFFCLDSLMQTIGPTATRHQTTRELIDNYYLAFLHHVVLITMEEIVRTQRGHQMMHQGDIARLI